MFMFWDDSPLEVLLFLENIEHTCFVRRDDECFSIEHMHQYLCTPPQARA